MTNIEHLENLLKTHRAELDELRAENADLKNDFRGVLLAVKLLTESLRHEQNSTSPAPIKNISVTEKGVYIECL